MAKINQIELERWRDLSAADVLAQIADYAKKDSTFVPIKTKESTRWNITISDRGTYEILTTGAKFYDTRTKTGGGGAIDLVMYLYGMDFITAASMLRKKGI